MELLIEISTVGLYTGIGMLVFFLTALYSRYQVLSNKIDFVGALMLSAIWPIWLVILPLIGLCLLYDKIARARY